MICMCNIFAWFADTSAKICRCHCRLILAVFVYRWLLMLWRWRTGWLAAGLALCTAGHRLQTENDAACHLQVFIRRQFFSFTVWNATKLPHYRSCVWQFIFIVLNVLHLSSTFKYIFVGVFGLHFQCSSTTWLFCFYNNNADVIACFLEPPVWAGTRTYRWVNRSGFTLPHSKPIVSKH